VNGASGTFPPDRHRARRRPAQPAQLHIRVERIGAGYQPRRPLRQRFMRAYGRAMIVLAKVIVATVVVIILGRALVLLAVIVR
jgi:hypothetical protein